MKYRQFIKNAKKRLHAPEPATQIYIIKLLPPPPPIYCNSKWNALDDNNYRQHNDTTSFYNKMLIS